MQGAEHIISFGRVYSHPKRSNNFTGIYVSVSYNSAVCAFKTLIGSFSNVIASATSLTCVSRWYSNALHTIKQRLVFNISPKHRKIPFTKFSPKLFVSPFACKTDSSKIFNNNSLTLLFSRLIGATTYDELAEQGEFFLPENHDDPQVVLAYYESIEDYEKCKKIIERNS